jgi:ubiquinone/menaquinone biosynthesis C-methylase UbiE
MDKASEPNHDQAALWNGSSGRAWVEKQDVLDRMFEPLERRLVEAIPVGPRSRVLDVGCGTGSTTLAISRRLGATGRCTGIDISAPMIDLARARAAREDARAEFVRADAQVHPFTAGSFELIVSRFGVMFFDDPVRAFANLRRATRDGGGLRFIAWRSADENPFMTTAERAAAPLLPDLPARSQGGPGQFAFADPSRVAKMLREAGWSEIDIQPLDTPCTLPVAELRGYLGWIGPLGRALRGADDATRVRVVDAVRGAFEPFVQGDEVRYSAACWMVTARAAG